MYLLGEDPRILAAAGWRRRASGLSPHAVLLVTQLRHYNPAYPDAH